METLWEFYEDSGSLWDGVWVSKLKTTSQLSLLLYSYTYVWLDCLLPYVQSGA